MWRSVPEGGVGWREGEREREKRSLLWRWRSLTRSLTQGQRHGLCTGAYPSWSRKSSPPGWFGRALKDERRQTQRQSDWRETRPELISHQMWIYTVFYWPEQARVIYSTAFTFSFLHRVQREMEGVIDCRWQGERDGGRGGDSRSKDRGRFFRWHCAGTARRDGAARAPRGAVSIKMTYSTDEAGIVPAVAQGLQKPIAGINLKVTAVAFGAKHLLIVCRERERKREREVVRGEVGGRWRCVR